MKKLIATALVVIIISVSLLSLYYLSNLKDEEIVIPEPGEIKVEYKDLTKIVHYNFSIKFEETVINVTSKAFNKITNEQLFQLQNELNRTNGENIWTPLMRESLENKGYVGPQCKCDPEDTIEMIDNDGITTEFVHCPDPTTAGVMTKTIRIKLYEPRDVG